MSFVIHAGQSPNSARADTTGYYTRQPAVTSIIAVINNALLLTAATAAADYRGQHLRIGRIIIMITNIVAHVVVAASPSPRYDTKFRISLSRPGRKVRIKRTPAGVRSDQPKNVYIYMHEYARPTASVVTAP